VEFQTANARRGSWLWWVLLPPSALSTKTNTPVWPATHQLRPCSSPASCWIQTMSSITLGTAVAQLTRPACLDDVKAAGSPTKSRAAGCYGHHPISIPAVRRLLRNGPFYLGVPAGPRNSPR